MSSIPSKFKEMTVTRVPDEARQSADKKRSARQWTAPPRRNNCSTPRRTLFYREGIRAIGVDAVVERAGVNKMSVYRQFSSKEDLVVAYLHAHGRKRSGSAIEASVAKHPDAAGKAARAEPSTDLVGRASAPDYRGCPFVNVACEFSDPAHPARLVRRATTSSI